MPKHKSNITLYLRIVRRFFVELMACFLNSFKKIADVVREEEIFSIPPQPLEKGLNGNLLVVVNPKSGNYRALHVFYKHIAQKLIENNIKFEIVITTHRGHGYQMAKTRKDLHEFNGIVVCSGDGTVSEIMNGLLQRPDRSELIPKLSIGVIPSGSGNALISSVFYDRGLPIEPQSKFLQTAYSIIPDLNAISVPVNLMHIEAPTYHMGSCLSIGWGLLPKLDLDTEKLRSFCGSGRFFWGALIQAIKHRSYKGKLSYLPYTTSESQETLKPFKVYEKHASKDLDVNANILPDVIPKQGSENDDVGEFWRRHHPKNCEKIPSINEEVPSSWVTLDEEFQFVYAISLSHIIHKCNYIPKAGLVDDKIYLTYALKRDVDSKIMLARFIEAIEKGGCQEFDFFRVVPVKSFRLEPADDRCYIVVDGDPIDAPKVQVTVSSFNINVMTK